MLAEMEDFITVKQAARECHRTSETVRRWIWEGKLPAQKLGNQLFVKRDELARLTLWNKRTGGAERLAALAKAKVVRERIRQRIGGNLDVLEMLERSREAHP